MDEQRNRLRHELRKLAFAKNETGARGGLLIDISSSGAALQFVNPLGKVDQIFSVGDRVEITIDGFTSLFAHVVRSNDEGIFVAFELHGDDEKLLLSEIMAVLNDMDAEVLPEA